MPKSHLSDAFVRNVKLPRKNDKQKQVMYFHNMERGLSLVLVVSYGGTKRWRVLTYSCSHSWLSDISP